MDVRAACRLVAGRFCSSPRPRGRITRCGWITLMSNLGEVEGAIRHAMATGASLRLPAAAAPIPGELLSSILTSSETTVHPRGLALLGAQVHGPLNLESAALRGPLTLNGCQLDAAITLTRAVAPAVRLISCHLPALFAAQLHANGNLDLQETTSLAHGRQEAWLLPGGTGDDWRIAS